MTYQLNSIKDKMMKLNPMNKKGGFIDLFVFMIFAFVIIIFIAVFIFIGIETEEQVRESIGNIGFFQDNNINTTKIIDDTIGEYNEAMKAFYWLTILIIAGMILAIWIASYLTTTKPVFFISSIFVTAIAVTVATVMSNAYELIIYSTPELTPIFMNFVGANWIMLKLPVWISIIGFVSAIIMYSGLGGRDGGRYGY